MKCDPLLATESALAPNDISLLTSIYEVDTSIDVPSGPLAMTDLLNTNDSLLSPGMILALTPILITGLDSTQVSTLCFLTGGGTVNCIYDFSEIKGYVLKCPKLTHIMTLFQDTIGKQPYMKD